MRSSCTWATACRPCRSQQRPLLDAGSSRRARTPSWRHPRTSCRRRTRRRPMPPPSVSTRRSAIASARRAASAGAARGTPRRRRTTRRSDPCPARPCRRGRPTVSRAPACRCRPAPIELHAAHGPMSPRHGARLGERRRRWPRLRCGGPACRVAGHLDGAAARRAARAASVWPSGPYGEVHVARAHRLQAAVRRPSPATREEPRRSEASRCFPSSVRCARTASAEIVRPPRRIVTRARSACTCRAARSRGAAGDVRAGSFALLVGRDGDVDLVEQPEHVTLLVVGHAGRRSRSCAPA